MATVPLLTSFKRHDWLYDLVVLTLLISVLYLAWLGSYPLFIPDEGRYSEVAREMVATGDYITPRVNGVVFLDKPILYYWLQAAAIRLFGVNEWALRLFPALFAVLGSVMTYLCGRRLFNRRTGILSAIILATTPLYFGGGHYANLDLEVGVLISGTLLFFITAMQDKGRTRMLFLLCAYFFAACAMLTKGLIGVAFPGLIGLIWMGCTQRFHELNKLYLFAGIAIFLAVVLPWYYLAQQANPEFLHYFFITQQFTRFLSGAEFNNASPVWFYLPIVLIGFLPWTLFLLQAIRHAIEAIKQQQKNASTTLYLLIWASVIFVFFSIPRSKSVGYILPIFPALALLTGNYVSLRWESLATRTQQYFKIAATTSTVFLLMIAISAKHINYPTTKPLVTTLKTVMHPQDEVINYYKFYQDLPIYLEQRVTLVANWNSPEIPHKDNWVREMWYGMPFQNTADWLINEDTFWRRFDGDKRVFVFLNENYFSQFKAHAHRYFVIDTHNDIILLSNKATIIASRTTFS